MMLPRRRGCISIVIGMEVLLYIDFQFICNLLAFYFPVQPNKTNCSLMLECRGGKRCLIRVRVYGYPLEIQALFSMALRCTKLLLKGDDEGKEFIEKIVKRLRALSYHMRRYYWLDLKQLTDIY